MIGISSIDNDSNEPVQFKESTESTIRELTARVSRTATLDGGAVIVHGGTTDADRTLTIRADIDEATETAINTIFMNQTSVHVSTVIGYFKGSIRRLSVDNGELTLEILVEEKLSS